MTKKGGEGPDYLNCFPSTRGKNSRTVVQRRSGSSSMLVEVPGLRDLLPFMKMAYSSASSCVWADEKGGAAPSNSMGAGNQATPSCHFCSVWGYVKPSRKCGVRILGALVPRRFRGELPRGTVGRGAEIVGRNPINPRLAMFVAGGPPVRKGYMSSSVAHGSTTTVCRICAWARFWKATDDGSLGREDPRKPAGRRWHARPTMLHMKAC